MIIYSRTVRASSLVFLLFVLCSCRDCVPESGRSSHDTSSSRPTSSPWDWRGKQCPANSSSNSQFSAKFSTDLGKFPVGDIVGKFVFRMEEREPGLGSCRPDSGSPLGGWRRSVCPHHVEGGGRAGVGGGRVLAPVGGGGAVQGRGRAQSDTKYCQYLLC